MSITSRSVPIAPEIGAPDFDDRLRDSLELARDECRSWELRYLTLARLHEATTTTRSWRLAAPLRAMGRWIAPPRYSATELIPWHHLRPARAGADHGPDWVAHGEDPQFVLPCALPRGWVRIRLRLSGPAHARAELFTDSGSGFNAGERVELFFWNRLLCDDVYLYLPRPIFAMRLDPLEGPGEFRLEEFSVTPVSGPRAAVHALARKVELLRAYNCTGRALAKGAGLLARGQVGEVWRRFFKGLSDWQRLGVNRDVAGDAYAAWRKRHALTDADREALKAEAAMLLNPPRFSILMPVYNTPPEHLTAAIDSILKQTYPHWELCIADDGSSARHVRPLLTAYAARDPRVRVVFRPQQGGIAAASNSAMELATGDYFALVDHDDEIAEHALSMVAREITAHPQADFLYSDEDKIEADGRHVIPFFKPDWSPDYFLTCMYTCHLGVYRAAMVRRLGGFRSEFDTAQDYDLALRVVAEIQRTGNESNRIRHVRDILYHWRMTATSTASTHRNKPQAELTARRAVQSYIESMNRPGRVEAGPGPGLHRVRYSIRGTPKVSIVIPSACRPARIRGRETHFITHCIDSIRQKTTWPHYEILVIDNDDVPPDLARQLDDRAIVRISFTEPFNLSAKINLGASKADGEFLVLLNDDTEIISPDWLECMLEYAQWPEVGAVGTRLLFPDGRLQHIGVVLMGGRPTHMYYNFPNHHTGYWYGNLLPRNYSAVTGACMMTRTELFNDLGGFDRDFPLNYNDIDFCLRLIATCRRVVYTPYAQLYHFESASKSGIYEHEVKAFLARWHDRYPIDPFYSPHLSQRGTDYRIISAEDDSPGR
jgi:GT2 family glycosyltransferase